MRPAQRMHEGCTGDVPGIPRGCTNDAAEVHKGCMEMHEGWARHAHKMQKDAEGIHGGCREAQRLHRNCTKDARGAHGGCTRRADTFEDVVREQRGHLLVPLLHGKQDCEGERRSEPGPTAPQMSLFPPPKPAPQSPQRQCQSFPQCTRPESTQKKALSLPISRSMAMQNGCFTPKSAPV